MNCSKGPSSSCQRSWPWSTNEKPAPVHMSITEDQLKDFCKRYDINKDGCLSNKELQNAFQSLGSILPAWRAWRALCHADANGDGVIDEDELQGLANYMSKHGYVRK